LGLCLLVFLKKFVLWRSARKKYVLGGYDCWEREAPFLKKGNGVVFRVGIVVPLEGGKNCG